MFRDRRIAVVVPAYNEESQIGKVLATMPAWVDRVIAVDDASTDGTAAVIEEHCRTSERFVLLRRQKMAAWAQRWLTAIAARSRTAQRLSP